MHAVRGSYLAVGALLATISPFLGPILEQRGFTAAGIGLVLAVMAAGNALAMPVWGHLGDVAIGRRRALQLAGLGGAAGAALFGAAGPLPAIAVALVAYSLLTSGCGSLLDAIGVNALAERPELYGRFRMLESVSYALVALAVGAICTAVGYGAAYVLAAACALLVTVIAQAVPDVPRARLGDYRAAGTPREAPDPRHADRDTRESAVIPREADAAHAAGDTRESAAIPRESDAAHAAGDTRESAAIPREADAAHAAGDRGRERRIADAFGSAIVAVRVAPRVLGVMATVVLASTGYMTALTFLPLRLVEVGGDPTIVALSSTVSALSEVPAMLLTARLVRPIGLRGLGILACVLYAAALASWVVLGDALAIVAMRVLLGLGFGTLTVTGVLTVGALLPARLQASGQALLGMSVSGIAWTIASLAGGIIYDRLGHAPVFALAAAAALGAAVLAWAFLPARGEVRTAPGG